MQGGRGKCFMSTYNMQLHEMGSTVLYRSSNKLLYGRGYNLSKEMEESQS